MIDARAFRCGAHSSPNFTAHAAAHPRSRNCTSDNITPRNARRGRTTELLSIYPQLPDSWWKDQNKQQQLQSGNPQSILTARPRFAKHARSGSDASLMVPGECCQAKPPSPPLPSPSLPSSPLPFATPALQHPRISSYRSTYIPSAGNGGGSPQLIRLQSPGGTRSTSAPRGRPMSLVVEPDPGKHACVVYLNNHTRPEREPHLPMSLTRTPRISHVSQRARR